MGYDTNYDTPENVSDGVVPELRERIRALEAQLAEAKQAAEFNFEQYQDAARMLCEESAKAEALRQQLAAAKFARRQAETDKSDVERTLAAAQAREQQLREALQWYANENHITKLHGRESQPESRGKLEDAGFIQVTVGWTDVFVETGGKANEAIVQPTDTSTLEAMIAKAGEVMRERCAKQVELRQGTKFGSPLEDAIRALPGVTLEDLK